MQKPIKMNHSKHPHAFMSYAAKHILLFIGILITIMSFGQVQTQKGISYRYNGKNPRTPLPNVTVECVSANNTAISDSTGSFTLVFNKLKMGDRMGMVTVKKREMMVFNQHAVDEWSIRKEPLCLILCDAKEFDRQKQELIAIGKREAQKKYDRQKADLEQQLEASQIDRARYEAELDTAWQELDRLHKHIDEYADLFARIDQSEIDTLAQQAMDLFNQGKVDEAVQLFEQGNYLEKLRQDNRTIQQADQLIEAAEQAKANAEEEREMHIRSLKAQVEAYKMQNEWKKAKTLLKGLADEQNTFMEIVTYASFCHNQNDNEESVAYYMKAFNAIQQFATNELMNDFLLAGVHYSLATIYHVIRHYQEAEQAYLTALELFQQHSDHDLFQQQIAMTLNGLGTLYMSINRLQDSESMHQNALIIRRNLAKADPQTYEKDLANSLNNLGELYYRMNRPSEAEPMFLESLEILRRLAKDDSQVYEPDLALTLNNLGCIYNFNLYTQRPSEAESMFLEALKIRRHLAKNNPEAYELSLAATLNDLAVLYEDIQRFTESEALYLEALKIYRRWANDNPEVFEPNLALTLVNLGIFYQKIQRFSESATMYSEALNIRRRLAKANPQAYEPDVASTLDNLANLYKNTQRLTESETMYLEALEIRRRLAKANPQAYEPYLAMTLCNIGFIHIQQEQYLQAISDFEAALAIYRELKISNPSYGDLYQKSLYWLTQLYPTTDNHARYYEINEEWLPILKGNYQEDAETWQDDYSSTLGNQSFQCIFVKQFEKSEQYAREGLAIDPSKQFIQTNLAAALLFQGKYTEAEQIYSQYKAELKDSFLKDLNDFEAAGIIPEERKADVEKIRKLLLE